MFFGTPGEPTKIKKVAYLTATTIIGLLLSFLAHVTLEMSYLSLMRASGQAVKFYGQCALPLVIKIILWLLGAIGGFYLGKFWWHKLYIERVWVKKIK